MSKKFSKEDCIVLIQKRAEELGTIPKKSDFDVETVSAIKSFFGPWPRAMEAAGVKEPNLKKIEQKREKRRRAKENQMKYRREHQKIKEDEK